MGLGLIFKGSIMAIIKTQTPYEFLVRWTNGAIAGAHIRYLERLVEDGVTITEKEGEAKPVSLAGESGFPIADILSIVQVNAFADLAVAQAALVTAQAKVTELQAKIDAYTPPAPTVTSQSITMRQARLALLGAGLLDQVNAGMSTMPQAAQIEWQFASEVRRDNALIGAMATALGLDDAAIDALFAAGADL